MQIIIVGCSKMNAMRHILRRIDPLRLQGYAMRGRPAFVKNSVSGRPCVTCRQYYVLSTIRGNPTITCQTQTHPTPRPSVCSKLYSTSTSAPIIKQWEYKLQSFGKLILGVSSVNCFVSPIDPNDYPEQDLVQVVLSGSNGQESIKCDIEGQDVRISQVLPTDGDLLEIKVPIKYDLYLDLKENANIDVSNLENELINIYMEEGDCQLSNIKSGTVLVSSKLGNISSTKTLQGNVTIRTGKTGTVNLHKAVCNDLTIETESGDICVTSLYAQKSYMNTRRGNIHIGTCHRDTMVNIQHIGNLNIGTLDGSLLASVTHGDVAAHIMKHDQIQLLLGKGSVNLHLGSSSLSQVELRADSVNIEDGLDTGKLNKQPQGEQVFYSGSIGESSGSSLTESTPPSLVVSTGQGGITLGKQDWMHAIKQKYENKE